MHRALPGGGRLQRDHQLPHHSSGGGRAAAPCAGLGAAGGDGAGRGGLARGLP